MQRRRSGIAWQHEKSAQESVKNLEPMGGVNLVTLTRRVRLISAVDLGGITTRLPSQRSF